MSAVISYVSSYRSKTKITECIQYVILNFNDQAIVDIM